MNIFRNSLFYIILYLGFAVTYNQLYKINTKKMKKAGALTVLVEGLAGIIILLLMPFFKIKFPSDYKVYIFLGIAIIFYAIYDRLATNVRSGIEASTYSIIKQMSTVFMIIAGLIFFKEPFILNKIIGAFLIVISNILVFYKKGEFKLDKYVALGIGANIFYTVALFIDVNLSDNFNLPFYISMTLIIPALLIMVFERIKLKDIVDEYKNGNKIAIGVTATTWGLMIFAQLMAYNLGNVTVVAPLCSLTVILNVIVGYLFLGEKSNLGKKIIASILVIISVLLIKL